jgi:hypothetical protein
MDVIYRVSVFQMFRPIEAITIAILSCIRALLAHPWACGERLWRVRPSGGAQ